MLEHLTVLQVKQTVANMVRMTSKFIYVTTRFHPNPANLLDFTTQFDVDPTHITLLNKDMLRLMFVLEGCRSRPDLEARMDWGNKGRVLVLEKLIRNDRRGRCMPVASSVRLGRDVVIHHPDLVNLYGCEIGDETKIGAFVEIQKNAIDRRAAARSRRTPSSARASRSRTRSSSATA